MSSVLSLMESLSASGYIQLDPDTKSYVPTLRVAMLGTWIMGNLFMDGAVIALMDQVQKDTGETVILGARNGLHAQYLHTVQSRRLLRFFVKPGLLRPMSRRSEEHTSELQSLMRISYAVFCLKKQQPTSNQH